MPVRLLHALEGILDRGIAPRHTARETALLLDPCLHALGDRLLALLGEHLGRPTETLDGDEVPHFLWINAGIAECDVASERMPDDRDGCQLLLMNELCHVIDVTCHGVAAGSRPLAVAVAAQVGRDD